MEIVLFGRYFTFALLRTPKLACDLEDRQGIRRLQDIQYLQFNELAGSLKIFPETLQLGSTVKGYRAELILQKAQYQLLNEMQAHLE